MNTNYFNSLHLDFLNMEILYKIENTIFLILVVFLIVLLLRKVFQFLINNFYRKQLESTNNFKARKRIATLTNVESSLTITIGIIISMFFILSIFITNITTLFAGAGILGLAISFGAQSLVKDIFTGINFLIKDQFDVGDVVQIGTSLIGRITSITLTTITIRDFNGNITTFSNSSISQITNLSKDWSLVNVKMNFSSSLKIDDAYDVLKEAGKITEEDPTVSPYILEKTSIVGLTTLDKDKMEIEINLKTTPGKQFDIERIYKYNLKKLIEKKNIFESKVKSK